MYFINILIHITYYDIQSRFFRDGHLLTLDPYIESVLTVYMTVRGVHFLTDGTVYLVSHPRWSFQKLAVIVGTLCGYSGKVPRPVLGWKTNVNEIYELWDKHLYSCESVINLPVDVIRHAKGIISYHCYFCIWITYIRKYKFKNRNLFTKETRLVVFVSGTIKHKPLFLKKI
jgi:hypothetical protein